MQIKSDTKPITLLLSSTAVFFSLYFFWPKFGHPEFLFDKQYWLMHASGALALAALWLLMTLFKPNINIPSTQPLDTMCRPFWVIPVSGILLLYALHYINVHILHQFMNSADEQSCLFMAHLLMEHKVMTAPPPLPEFFDTPHIGIKDGKWFSVYPPVWPFLWSIGIRLGLQHLTNPILLTFGLSILLFSVKTLISRTTLLLSAIFIIISPFFLFTGAAYNSHNSCFLFFTIYFYSSYQWVDKKSSYWALLAGLSLGLGLGARYLTMGGMAFPFILYGLFLVFKKRLKLNDGIIHFTVVSVGLLIAQLLFNYIITGDLTDAPNHYVKRHERLGFIAGYTPGTALLYWFRRIIYLMDWNSLFLPLLFIFYSTTHFKRLNVWLRLLTVSVLSLSVFYMFYYSWGGNQFGPRYLYEAYPLMVILVMHHLVLDYNQSDGPKRLVIIFLLLISMLSTVTVFMRHADYFERASRERKQIYVETEQTVEEPALVFIKGFIGDTLVMSQEDAVRNLPDLKGDIIYAHDKGEKNRLLCEAMPDKNFYKAHYNRDKKQSVITTFDCLKGTEHD